MNPGYFADQWGVVWTIDLGGETSTRFAHHVCNVHKGRTQMGVMFIDVPTSRIDPARRKIEVRAGIGEVIPTFFEGTNEYSDWLNWERMVA